MKSNDSLILVFWLSLIIIFYSYIGYGILIYLLVRIKRLFGNRKDTSGQATFEPEVTLVVSAFNEEDFIEKKIKNTLELDYPAQKLQIYFITDGSSDRTPDIISRFSQIRLLHQPERRGKVAAMNRAIKMVETPYVIFSDANTLLNKACLREMLKHYQDPKVGGVAGEKKVMPGEEGQVAEVGEGIYWKYESFLKRMDSEFYTVVGAAGELFSVQTRLFEPTAENVIIEDFVQSLTICRKGYVIRYEPNAYAMESGSASMKEEEKRKIRISAGAFQAMVLLKDLFNILKYPVLSFQFLSHRILRWTLCPLGLLVCFFSNLALAFSPGTIFYMLVLLAQILFYSMAFAGWAFAKKNIKVKALYIPYYFAFMNFSVFLGFARFLKGKQSVLWEKASRQKMV